MPGKAIALLSLLFLYSAHEAHGQVQLTEREFKNVYQIKAPSGKEGSAFALQVDGRYYLVTAKHMVSGLKVDGSIESVKMRELNSAGQALSLKWEPLKVKIFTCNPPIDIAILVPEAPLRPGFPPLEASAYLMAVGQDGYFLGFPLGFAFPSGGAAAPYPIGFVKRASLSSVSPEDHLLLFDGENNHGFSGGPFVTLDLYSSNPNRSTFYVHAVMSGFVPELVNTAVWREKKPGESLDSMEKWRIRDIDGSTEILEDTKTVTPLNTGIIVGYDIKHAVELIKAHPIGPQLSEPAR